MKENKNINRRTLKGIVVSVDSNNVKVRVETKSTHPKYGKVVMSHKNYIAKNIEEVEVKEGSKVLIEETKPITKTIKFVLLKAF